MKSVSRNQPNRLPIPHPKSEIEAAGRLDGVRVAPAVGRLARLAMLQLERDDLPLR